MTRIIFYTGVADRLRFLQNFLQKKVLQVAETVLIYGEDETIRRLDDDLWTENFLPHERLESNMSAGDTPIFLSSSAPPDDYTGAMLISLHPELPGFLGRFPVYIDIVGNDDSEKQRGRRRFRYFREHGYPIDCHAMG